MTRRSENGDLPTWVLQLKPLKGLNKYFLTAARGYNCEEKRELSIKVMQAYRKSFIHKYTYIL